MAFLVLRTPTIAHARPAARPHAKTACGQPLRKGEYIQMKTVDLPVVSSAASLKTSFQQMVKQGRTAVVERQGNAFRIHTARDIVRASAKGLFTLGELRTGRPLDSIEVNDLARHGARLSVPTDSSSAYESILREMGDQDYGLLTSTDRSAIIVTRSEGLGFPLEASPAYCYCSRCGDSVPEGTTRCPKCHSPIDCITAEQ